MKPGSSGKARPITKYGTTVLHRKCKPVRSFDAELAQLIEDMFASMYQAKGVGLAANQIGVGLQVFVVDCADADDNRTVAHIVNPTLILPPQPRPSEMDDEGCLSVPGPYAKVRRSASAAVTGFDQLGNPIRIEGTGQLARCLQHEYDHLQGKVYVDLLTSGERLRLLDEAGLKP